METRKIKTFVNGNNVTYGKNKFVLGRISGAMAVMCEDALTTKGEFAIDSFRNGDRIFKVRTTDEKYKAFASVIERWYPGLCIFDYDGSKPNERIKGLLN